MRGEPDPNRLPPDECEWVEAGDFFRGKICHRRPTVRCRRYGRQRYVCGVHAGAHKRFRPAARACRPADHEPMTHTHYFERFTMTGINDGEPDAEIDRCSCGVTREVA